MDDLLDVARIEAGKLGLDLREVSPEVIVHNAVESYLPLATGVSIQLEAEVAPGLPLGLADEERIQQVLGNLLNNAIKFTPPGGRVRIVAQQEGDEIRFAVMDTGPGYRPTICLGSSIAVAVPVWGLPLPKGSSRRTEGTFELKASGEGSTLSFTLRVLPPARSEG